MIWSAVKAFAGLLGVHGEQRPAAPIGQWLPYVSWTLAVAVGCPCLWVLGMQGAAIVIVAAATAGYADCNGRGRYRFHSPSSFMLAGRSTARMIVASISTAVTADLPTA